MTWFPSVAAALGYAYTLSGRVLDAFPLLQQAVAQDTSRGITAGHARRVAYLSEAYVLAGRIEEAVDLAASALAFARTLKARGNEAYALWLLGEIHAQQEPLAGAATDAYYQQALTLAAELGMRPSRPTATEALARCIVRWASPSRLVPHYPRRSTCTVMEMTFWLPETEAVLAQVEGR